MYISEVTGVIGVSIAFLGSLYLVDACHPFRDWRELLQHILGIAIVFVQSGARTASRVARYTWEISSQIEADPRSLLIGVYLVVLGFLFQALSQIAAFVSH